MGSGTGGAVVRPQIYLCIHLHTNVRFIAIPVSGNMSGGFLRCGVPGEAMVGGMPVQVHGMLWTAAFREETHLYHRLVRHEERRPFRPSYNKHLRNVVGMYILGSGLK